MVVLRSMSLRYLKESPCRDDFCPNESLPTSERSSASLSGGRLSCGSLQSNWNPKVFAYCEHGIHCLFAYEYIVLVDQL